MDDAWRANAERFTGFADTYDRHRPHPPAALVDILTQLAGVQRPALVVDLGCGTGLATRLWADRAEQVIGVDPSDDMRRQAQKATTAPNVSFRAGLSHDTGLPVGGADIVTCSQSLHWMDPKATFEEVRRILRRGGVFAACDCDWPPALGSWEVEQAYNGMMLQRKKLAAMHNTSAGLRRWAKDGHLSRMQESGCFRYTREILLHHEERGDAERLLGLARSFGAVADLLKAGLSETEIGLDRLRDVARRELGDEPRPWWFSYRVRIGVV